jgi:hypothetical protein
MKKRVLFQSAALLRGDNFPSTEAFITDSSGNNLFIGVGQIATEVDKDFDLSRNYHSKMKGRLPVLTL